MSSTFKVRLTKDYLVFSAAHFITFNGNVCERLHGHNYRVAAEVAGTLDENHYVVDFVVLRDALQKIVTELDHYMLLPTQHPHIHVDANECAVEVTFEDRRWMFPRGDCVLLPVPNTTAEKLAEYIGRRLLDELQTCLSKRPTQISVEVDECNGQIGVCHLSNE